MISIKNQPYSELTKNKFICKMILLHSIECKYDLFRAVINSKNGMMDNSKMDYVMPFSLLLHDDTIVGFIVEKEFKQLNIKDMILALDIVYIIPEYRKRGYCTKFLNEYSKLPRIVIASQVISKLIIRILKSQTDDGIKVIDASYIPNLQDMSNPENFINKDNTSNWLSQGLQKKYRKN